MDVSKLLENKEETEEYLELYTKIMLNNTLNYNNLYYLVIQIWLDNPSNYISLEFRKKMIKIGIKDNISSNILKEIKENKNKWFNNVGHNESITELINWMCLLYPELIDIKKEFDKDIKIKITNDIELVKKKKGLCSYIRDNQECKYKERCAFYHGKIEETYGIQECIHKEKCKFLSKGTCLFIHKPNNNDIKEIKNIYSKLIKTKKGYKTKENIEKKILNNRYITLKKIYNKNNMTYYSVPMCKECNKEIRLATQNNFYCSYEHLRKNEYIATFIVKQNIQDIIFLN